jgi:hypothetical protein
MSNPSSKTSQRSILGIMHNFHYYGRLPRNPNTGTHRPHLRSEDCIPNKLEYKTVEPIIRQCFYVRHLGILGYKTLSYIPIYSVVIAGLYLVKAGLYLTSPL